MNQKNFIPAHTKGMEEIEYEGNAMLFGTVTMKGAD